MSRPLAGGGARRRPRTRRPSVRAMALAALLALTACTNGGGGGPTRPTDDPLPQIATDPCPAPADLLAREPQRGERLPDVTLPCLGHDSRVRLRALGGRPYVVNLWASWCGPCKDEMPAFQTVKADLGTKVGFLGVNTKDRERNARAIVQNTAITYASVVDEDGKVQRALGARSLPTTALVGADGLIRTVHVGELTGPELRDLIEKHLGVR